MTLQQVADACHLSKSFVSQIENGATTPSVASLKAIVNALGGALGDFFLDEPAAHDNQGNRPTSAGADNVRVVRQNRRKLIRWPGSTAVSYLLTPDLRRKLEIILSEMKPGDLIEYEPYQHDGEEFGLVLEGTYEITVGDQVFVLEAGDSIYYLSRLPHRMRAIGKSRVRTLWVITPPSF